MTHHLCLSVIQAKKINVKIQKNIKSRNENDVSLTAFWTDWIVTWACAGGDCVTPWDWFLTWAICIWFLTRWCGLKAILNGFITALCGYVSTRGIFTANRGGFASNLDGSNAFKYSFIVEHPSSRYKK